MTVEDDKKAIRQHLRLLGHEGHGVIEFRVFKSPHGPMVAYADNEDDAVRLCLLMADMASGIYVGAQPRPLFLFDGAPNQWKPALSGNRHNCARDKDIENITTAFFDIDVQSKEHGQHPASELELRQSDEAAQMLIRENALASHATICCSGNGHYVLAPIVPIPVDTPEVAIQFKLYCEQRVGLSANKVSNVRFDPVFNASRLMRVMGTVNRKGQPTAARPHRRAHFVTKPSFARSMALHHKILNFEIQRPFSPCQPLPGTIRCDLEKLKECKFIQWCRSHPQEVTEPHWFALITNLTHLDGGSALIHEISSLDKARYDQTTTQRVIDRVLRMGYQPQCCRSFTDNVGTQRDQRAFKCSRIETCPARAPVYIAVEQVAQSTTGVCRENHEPVRKEI